MYMKINNKQYELHLIKVWVYALEDVYTFQINLDVDLVDFLPSAETTKIFSIWYVYNFSRKCLILLKFYVVDILEFIMSIMQMTNKSNQ